MNIATPDVETMSHDEIRAAIAGAGFPLSGPTHADVAEDEGEPRWVAHGRHVIAYTTEPARYSA